VRSIVPDLEQEIRLRAAQIENKLIAWRRDIHEHPELGEQETRTSGLVAEHLASSDLNFFYPPHPNRIDVANEQSLLLVCENWFYKP
jgi:hypothetical protein